MVDQVLTVCQGSSVKVCLLPGKVAYAWGAEGGGYFPDSNQPLDWV